jgi:hypothetical protein
MANIPYPHTLPDGRSGGLSMLKMAAFYVLMAGIAIAIAIPAAFATIGAQ